MAVKQSDIGFSNASDPEASSALLTGSREGVESVNGIAIAQEVDARGLRCPLPLLRAKQALRDLSSGEALRVRATDSGSVRDFQSFADLSGHQLLDSGEVDGVYIYILLKS